MAYELTNSTQLAAVQSALGMALANAAASANPTVNDDSNAGYSVGSYWRRASTGREWICVSAAVGAAVWRSISKGFKLPSGACIMADNIGSINASFTSTSPLRTYSPITIGGLGTFSWEIMLNTPVTGGEMRVAVYDEDADGSVGAQLVAPVVVDLSTGTNTIKNAALGWTPTRVGKFWIMQHVKANNPQIVTPRVGDGIPGAVFAANTVTGASNFANLPRYLTSAESYGSDPTSAPTVSGSSGSDCPVGWLKAA